jgi:hypothetical protein
MSDDSVQNYGNHLRFLAPWHFVAFPILLINAIVHIVALAKAPSLATLWAVLVAVALAMAIFFSRWMVLQVQDRVIRLEERLRLERLLPGRHADVEKLSRGQLVAIRFASDAEVPHLVDRIVSGEMRSKDDIKRGVQHWRPDHFRA